MQDDEFFGTESQRDLLKRGRSLAEILKEDKRFSYYGRTVGLTRSLDGDMKILTALARAQGNSNCAEVPVEESQQYATDLEARGLVPLIYQKWEGTERSLATSRSILDSVPLPGDISIVRVDRETSADLLQSAAKTALKCGVLPTCGAALRGQLQPAVCFLAVDGRNKVASIAAASAFAHPDHSALAGQAWWGMLATDPSHRGQKLALVLGAHAMLEMESRFGFGEFMTGVEAGNSSSEAVCTKMGLEPRGKAIVGCADPAAVKGGRMTK